MGKLTTSTVESLNGTGKTRYEAVALGGSLVARGLAGRVRYYYQYWHNGKKSRCPIGDHSRGGDSKGSADSTAFNLAGARARAIKLAAIQQEHGDLLAYQREKRDAASEALERSREDRTERQREVRDYSLGKLCEAYWLHLAAENKSSAADVRNSLKRWVIKLQPRLAERKASDITTGDILIVLRAIIDAGHTTQTNRVRSYLSSAFTFGLGSTTDPLASSRVSGFRLTSNPVAPVKRVASFEKAGERVLSGDELGELLRRLDATDSNAAKTVALSLRLGGQRIQQLLASTNASLDIENDTLTLKDGKGRRTSARLHILPLTASVKPLVIEALCNPHPRRSGLYHGLTLATVSKLVRQISKEMEKTGCEPFGWRDLRRTCETMLASMGISKDLRAQLQSHGLSGVQDRHYDKHQYIDEKRVALESWNARLDELKTTNKAGNNVIQINRSIEKVL